MRKTKLYKDILAICNTNEEIAKKVFALIFKEQANILNWMSEATSKYAPVYGGTPDNVEDLRWRGAGDNDITTVQLIKEYYTEKA